jgi:hypothetical protein
MRRPSAIRKLHFNNCRSRQLGFPASRRLFIGGAMPVVVNYLLVGSLFIVVGYVGFLLWRRS